MSAKYKGLNEAIATDLLSALEAKQQIPPLTTTYPEFDLAQAYDVSAIVRQRRQSGGAKPIGRKIGFTNRTIWEEYGVYAPIWGDMYDTTVTDLAASHDTCDLSAFIEPRVEPEIVFELYRTPSSDMSDEEFISCIARAAHGFEIVQSPFPGWIFQAADTAAAFGLHGQLFLGPWLDIKPSSHKQWLSDLCHFEIELSCNNERVDTGIAQNVLDGPLKALRHLCEVLENGPQSPQLRAGEIITTGTITRAFVIKPDQVWQTKVSGLPLDGIRLAFI